MIEAEGDTDTDMVVVAVAVMDAEGVMLEDWLLD